MRRADYMSFLRYCSAVVILLVVSVPATLHTEASRPTSQLGKIEFPTSGSPTTQRHFLRGVAAMHSFWYEEALDEFRRSTATDPDFAMAYWGEAMAHNHPIWREQDVEAARQALEKIGETNRLTSREQAYLNAVRLLYGDGDKRSRDKAYSAAMEKIYRAYPDDLEAACFYALSLLGRGRKSDEGFRLQIQAGAITLDVFQKNPDHPCAAHYTIHAFDHPDLAILALPAARRYARIAPESHHAQHMPSHIFLQLGMWPEAAASSNAGWKESVSWVSREGLPMGLRDYHSLQWLHYMYLQQGRYKKADQLLELKLKNMREVGHDPKAMASGFERRVGRYYERMAAASVVETQRWESAATLEDAPGSPPNRSAQAILTFARGFGAAMQGSPDASRHLATLQALSKSPIDADPFHRPERLDIWELEVTAAMHASKGDYDKAIGLVSRAVRMEESLPPPSGPPRIIKPTHELLGEILLRAGRPEEALKRFSTSLMRHPNRVRSLVGAARAARQTGDRAAAADSYSKLLESWVHADHQLTELQEARDFLKRPGAL